MGKKKNDTFNSAFHDLDVKLLKVKKPSEKTPPEPLAPEPEGIDQDEVHFFKAMSDVTPLRGNKRKSLRYPGESIRPSHPAPDDIQEGLTHLTRLVRGTIEMDITFTDEYMEGSVRGVSPKIMRRLKKGRYPYQDYIDLHGMTKEEAEPQVRDFLLESHRHGYGCVLIVHGRGLNSPDSLPVLKDRLPLWLNRAPIKKIVLAFATAKPYDGGPGAIYVLLRRR